METTTIPINMGVVSLVYSLILLCVFIVSLITLIWWWNEIWYVYLPSVKGRCKLLKAKLPPGNLGIPLFGEYFTFLCYFHFLRRPDSFITSKIHKYGKNVGAYKTYLYGGPAIIACSPTLCKSILTSTTGFKQGWPSSEVLGTHSVITLHGSRHQLIKGILSTEFNRRDTLDRLTLQVQPCIVHALHSWSQIGHINTFHQVKKVALEFMVRYMCGLEIGPEVDDLEKLFSGVTQGIRAQPWNFAGSPYRHALQCRKKLAKKLKLEFMKKKKEGKKLGKESDMMDRLMQAKDDDEDEDEEKGKYLSEEEVIDNVLTSIAISHIGIGYLVTWCIYFISNNPHVLHKLREENMEMAKEKNGDGMTYDDYFLRLKYTNKVVEETNRVASLSGFLFKKATEDVEFEGYLIPKGWNVLVWLRHLHNDPTNFEHPMLFNPTDGSLVQNTEHTSLLEEAQGVVQEVSLFVSLLSFFYITWLLDTGGS